mmetsp:Transcript_14991/g.47703  ORF Transcript_14991/g.47703 Transcript_14991/m.47703 type:complete len:230 (-) Transcript_14991:456-1145(-)
MTPLANKTGAVLPRELAVAVADAVDPIAGVLVAVAPVEGPLAVPNAVDPASVVPVTVEPVVAAFTEEVAVHPVARVAVAVDPNVGPFAMAHPLLPVPGILLTVRRSRSSKPIWHSALPVPDVRPLFVAEEDFIDAGPGRRALEQLADLFWHCLGVLVLVALLGLFDLLRGVLAMPAPKRAQPAATALAARITLASGRVRGLFSRTVVALFCSLGLGCLVSLAATMAILA